MGSSCSAIAALLHAKHYWERIASATPLWENLSQERVNSIGVATSEINFSKSLDECFYALHNSPPF
jgi:hypothetical protein